MRFLLDMGLAARIGVFLRAAGHDAVHLRDQGLQRLDDRAIIEKARLEGRVILTHDLDFGRIVALGLGGVPSVVTFRLDDMTPESVIGRLEEVLTLFQQHLEDGALVSVNEGSTRVRSLPIARPQD